MRAQSGHLSFTLDAGWIQFPVISEADSSGETLTLTNEGK